MKTNDIVMDKETGKLYRVWGSDSDMGTYTISALSDHKDIEILTGKELEDNYVKHV